MTPSMRLFKRALQEKLAFIPMGASDPSGGQAAGPGGAPVDPNAGGPPAPGAMDPAAPAPPGAAMDPGAGAPPVDPAAAGAPVDPSMGAGAPPMPPMPPMDPMAGMASPEEPPKDPVDEQAKAEKVLGTGDAMVPLSQLKEFTVGVIEATKGKKTLDAVQPEPKEPKGGAVPGAGPGPVTGMPGFDPASMGSAFKTASVLKKAFGLRK